MENFKIPARFSMEVYITDGEWVTGKVDIGLPTGEYPTSARILHWVKRAEEQAKLQNEKLRLLTPEEFSKTILYEETGQEMSVAGCPEEWEDL